MLIVTSFAPARCTLWPKDDDIHVALRNTYGCLREELGAAGNEVAAGGAPAPASRLTALFFQWLSTYAVASAIPGPYSFGLTGLAGAMFAHGPVWLGGVLFCAGELVSGLLLAFIYAEFAEYIIPRSLDLRRAQRIVRRGPYALPTAVFVRLCPVFPPWLSVMILGLCNARMPHLLAALAAGCLPQLAVVHAGMPLAARLEVDLYAGGFLAMVIRMVGQVLVLAPILYWSTRPQPTAPTPKPTRRSARIAERDELRARRGMKQEGSDEEPEGDLNPLYAFGGLIKQEPLD